jgi:hypothetical protein
MTFRIPISLARSDDLAVEKFTKFMHASSKINSAIELIIIILDIELFSSISSPE